MTWTSRKSVYINTSTPSSLRESYMFFTNPITNAEERDKQTRRCSEAKWLRRAKRSIGGGGWFPGDTHTQVKLFQAHQQQQQHHHQTRLIIASQLMSTDNKLSSLRFCRKRLTFRKFSFLLALDILQYFLFPIHSVYSENYTFYHYILSIRS